MKLPFSLNLFATDYDCPRCGHGYSRFNAIDGRINQYHCNNCNIVYEIKEISKVKTSEEKV